MASLVPTIAVFDSGVGGMTVLAALVKKMPGAKFVYYGDTANAPYGSRSTAEILRFSSASIEKLLTHQPDVVVIACNTVTSTSIVQLRAAFPSITFVGVEPAVKLAGAASRGKKVVVVATEATLRSVSYQALKKQWASGVEVIDLPKPAWVKMIENKVVNEGILQADALEIETTGADVLVLACTHFPFLKPKLQQLLPNMMIIDSAEPVAFRVQRLLAMPDGPTAGQPEIDWLFSDLTRPDEATRERLWTTAQQIG